MIIHDTRKKVSIYINKKDKYEGKPLYKALVETFFRMEVSGVSVFPSGISYGSNFILRGALEFPFFKNRGLLVQVIETEKKVREILPVLEKMIPNGIITIELVDMIRINKPAGEADLSMADNSARRLD